MVILEYLAFCNAFYHAIIWACRIKSCKELLQICYYHNSIRHPEFTIGYTKKSRMGGIGSSQ